MPCVDINAFNWKHTCPRLNHTKNCLGNVLKKNNLTFVGDSLSWQMYAIANCYLNDKERKSINVLPMSRLNLSILDTPFRQREIRIIFIGAWYKNLSQFVHNISPFLMTYKYAKQSIFVTPIPGHWYGGNGYSEQTRNKCLKHEHSRACSDRISDVTFAEPSINQFIQYANMYHVTYFNFYQLTKTWYDDHPGWRINHHNQSCDCLHFCYVKSHWDTALCQLSNTISRMETMYRFTPNSSKIYQTMYHHLG